MLLLGGHAADVVLATRAASSTAAKSSSPWPSAIACREGGQGVLCFLRSAQEVQMPAATCLVAEPIGNGFLHGIPSASAGCAGGQGMVHRNSETFTAISVANLVVLALPLAT